MLRVRSHSTSATVVWRGDGGSFAVPRIERNRALRPERPIVCR